MLQDADLPPSQLYILFGAIATACTIFVNRREQNRAIKSEKVARAFTGCILVFTTILATIPVAGPAIVDIFWPDADPSTGKFFYRWVHLAAVLLLFGLAAGTFLRKGFGKVPESTILADHPAAMEGVNRIIAEHMRAARDRATRQDRPE